MILLTLNLLAFLFHTVLHLVDLPYRQIRNQRGTRKGFFNDIQALTKYLIFESWQQLIAFMLADSEPDMSAQYLLVFEFTIPEIITKISTKLIISSIVGNCRQKEILSNSVAISLGEKQATAGNTSL